MALDLLVLDCSLPPQPQAPRNHNDLTRAQETQRLLQPKRTLLTHISHHLDLWLLDNELPTGLELAFDHLSVSLGSSAADPTPAP